VTTLYFESFKEDTLQVSEFSKDGKTSETQVVLGLLVSRDGYLLAYSLFNGSQFEGRTMIIVVDDFIQRYAIKDFALVILKLYKEVERLLKILDWKLSVDKTLDIAKTILAVTITLPSGETVIQTLQCL